MGIEDQKTMAHSMTMGLNWHRDQKTNKQTPKQKQQQQKTNKKKTCSIQIMSQNKSYYHITGSFPLLLRFLN